MSGAELARELSGCRALYGRRLKIRTTPKNVNELRDGVGIRSPFVVRPDQKFRQRLCLRPLGHEGDHRGPITFLQTRDAEQARQQREWLRTVGREEAS